MIATLKINNLLSSLNKTTYFSWFIIAFFVILFNEVGTKYTSFSMIILFLEYFTCIFLFFIGAVEYGFVLFVLCLSNTLEVQYFVTGIREMNGTFYSFAYLPVLKSFTLLILCFFMYVSIYFRTNYTGVNFSQNRNLAFLHRTICYMVVCGLFWMVFLFVLNDNGIMEQSWYVDLALKKIIRLFVIFLTIESCILLLLGRASFPTLLNDALLGSLFALPIAGFVGAMLGLTGYRGFISGLSILPISSSLGIYLLLFCKYPHFVNEKRKIILFSLLLVMYFILYPSQMGGKFVISCVVTIILFLFATRSFTLLFSIIVAFVLFVFSDEIINLLFGQNSFLLQKIEEAKSLFVLTVEGTNEIEKNTNVGSRFDEFLNVLYEFKNKPYYFLFGKGIAGSTLHYTNFLSWDGEAMFTPGQIASGVFVELHESTNVIFLRYGLIGLFGYGMLIWQLLKAIKKSPWAILGITWLVFYIDIFYSMFFGLVALILALYQSNKSDDYLTMK